MPSIVVIGRNEGERLRHCLLSALRQSSCVVYVDSGSTDGSSLLARSLGVAVVELDSSVPYTAARARNAGFHFLLSRNNIPDAVQFVDGDCELAEGWLSRAQTELDRRADAAAVCGRRRERSAGESIFKRLCDMEFDKAAGDVDCFDGDVLIRVSAFRMAGGFDAGLIAGEEPDLSLRLRRSGWKIVRLPAEMTLHESNIKRFGQWWRRTLRSGYAFAEGAWRHGLEPERHWLRQSLSIWFWGVGLPLSAAAIACVTAAGSIPIAAAYPALVCRIYVRMRRFGRGRRDALLYAVFCVLGKFPQALGQLRFCAGLWNGRRSGLIEYKLS